MLRLPLAHRALLSRLVVALMMTNLASGIAHGQDRYDPNRIGYVPYSQATPPGRAGSVTMLVDPSASTYIQPTKVMVEGGGQVEVYLGPNQQSIVLPDSGLVGLGLGRTYRLKITNIPGYPGLELYPSVELINRLHPPYGKEWDFPIPIDLTEEELDTALTDRLVTKVVYLELPREAAPVLLEGAVRVHDIPVSENVVDAAYRAGRPMAIVRIGGRVPSQFGESPQFYGDGGPVELGPAAEEAQ